MTPEEAFAKAVEIWGPDVQVLPAGKSGWWVRSVPVDQEQPTVGLHAMNDEGYAVCHDECRF